MLYFSYKPKCYKSNKCLLWSMFLKMHHFINSSHFGPCCVSGHTCVLRYIKHSASTKAGLWLGISEGSVYLMITGVEFSDNSPRHASLIEATAGPLISTQPCPLHRRTTDFSNLGSVWFPTGLVCLLVPVKYILHLFIYSFLFFYI